MKGMGRRSAVALATLLGTGLVPGGAVSVQETSGPAAGPVRLLVGFGQGSNSDVVARLLAGAMRPRLGRPVEVENRVGGSGNAMAEAVARAAPDGFTLGLLAPSFPVARHVTRGLPFDPRTDFTPISLIVTAPVLVHRGRVRGSAPGRGRQVGRSGAGGRACDEVGKYPRPRHAARVPWRQTGAGGRKQRSAPFFVAFLGREPSVRNAEFGSGGAGWAAMRPQPWVLVETAS